MDVVRKQTIERVDPETHPGGTPLANAPGPEMGHELIPLASGKAAQEFMKDHKGNHILRFDQIDLVLLNRLDEGTFE